MNSRVTMALAGLLLLGAVFVGYWGLMLNRQPEPVAEPAAPVAVSQAVEKVVTTAEDQTRTPVVVLLRDVPAFTPLTAEDLTLEKLRNAPAGSLSSLDQALGRTPWRTLAAGTWLNDESFSAGGPLARMIHSNERALAMAVDEVIGAGGQLNPGDYVDVLLFLRADASNLQQSVQVVIPAMRLLAVGEQLGLTNDGQPASPATTAEEKMKLEQRRYGARTVILAVPQKLLSRMMLATQVGTLRLAVRSSEEKNLARYWAGENDSIDTIDATNSQLFQFTELAMARAPKGGMVAGPVASGGTPAPRRGIEVIRGNQASQ